MAQKEMNVMSLSLEDMEKVFGGANELWDGWEAQVKETCKNLKKMGKDQNYAINLFRQMQPGHPEIEAYIIKIWDSL